MRGMKRRPESDPRLRTHSNTVRWDLLGFAAERLHAEGYNDSEIARLLDITPRTVKTRRARVREDS